MQRSNPIGPIGMADHACKPFHISRISLLASWRSILVPPYRDVTLPFALVAIAGDCGFVTRYD